MRRYIPSFRTRSNTNSASEVGDQLIRQITEQAQAILSQMSQQFAQDLQSQSDSMLRNALSGSLSLGDDADSDDDADAAASAGGLSALGGVSQLLSTGVRYLVSQPRTTTSAQETSRSQNATADFKLSNAQQMAEANIALSKGNKNL